MPTPAEVYTVILWIGYLNSALNPLLYVLLLRVDLHILKGNSRHIFGFFRMLKNVSVKNTNFYKDASPVEKPVIQISYMMISSLEIKNYKTRHQIRNIIILIIIYI